MSLRTPPRVPLVRAVMVAAVSALLLATLSAGLATASQANARTTYTSCTPAPAAPAAGIVIAGVRVARTTCAVGKAVTLAFTGCRLANGPAGRCVTRVRGFGCAEIRTNNPDGSFAAQVTCSKGDKKVRHSYRQAAAA